MWMHQSPRDPTDTVVAVFDSLDPTLGRSVEYKLAYVLEYLIIKIVIFWKDIWNIGNVIQF